MNFVSKALIVAVSIWALAMPAVALQTPTGPVILTISGKVDDKNTPDAAAFDLAMIEQLPQKTFTTLTPWDKNPITFTGPLLRDVLAAVKASGATIKAVALNDYQTRIPLEDVRTFDVVLACRMDGKLIPVRSKGPLFIVYPFDTDAQLRSLVYYERSAWQLQSLTIE